MRLAELKAKPDANHANAHPVDAWSCQLCNQYRATSPARGSGFKLDTTRTNHARMGVIGLRMFLAAILGDEEMPQLKTSIENSCKLAFRAFCVQL
jgi:hypothetical protein